MDRRTLLFVVSLGMTLFFVNMFFDYQNIEQRKEWLKQEEGRNKRLEKELQEAINEKAVAASELPLTTLYSDERREHPVAKAIVSGSAKLTLANGREPAKTLYDENGELLTLVKSDGQALLYAKDGKDASLEVAAFPDFGTYPLQLVMMEGEEVTLSPAELVDGQFKSLAAELYKVQKALARTEDTAPPLASSSVVLIEVKGVFLPLATYDLARNKLDILEESTLPTRLTKTVESPYVDEGKGASERFYVLENDYQQLVFSNFGGAIAEINLPFESESHPNSVVKEIEVGREMVAKHPYNALFPAHSYYTPSDAPAGPFVENSKGALGGYYPLLRRDLIEQGKRKSVKVTPEFYALNTVSKYPEMAQTVFKVTHFDKEKIVFEASQGNRRRITKTYTLTPKGGAPYSFDLTMKVEGDSSGLWITSGVPEVEMISGAPAPALKYRITRQGKGEVAQVSLPDEGTPVVSNTLQPDWLSNGNGFFGIIMDPLTEVGEGYRAQRVSGKEVPSRIVEIGEEYDRYNPEKLPGYIMALPLKNRGGTFKLRVFAGPYSTPILKAVDSIYQDPETGVNPDYIGCQTFHGWFAFISEPFAKFLFLLMNFFHWLTGSWALSIVLLTVALRVMLYPLNNWSTKSMTKMQELSPKIQALQQKYKNDKQKLQIETMNLYRESGVNPLSGCFPMLIQLPFLLGMFDLLKSSFQLRGASFIPGWIDNLTSPDVLFEWETPLPIIGNAFHLLPIILGATMFLQMRLSSPLPKDKSLWTEQQRQQRAMSTLMPIFFTWMFYSFPSGLNIYWISSTLLGMLQQWWTTKQMRAKSAQAAVQVEVKPGKGKEKRR